MSVRMRLNRHLALRARAAVLVDFDLAEFVHADDDPDTVMDFVTSECELVRAPGSGLRWAVTPRVRTETLASSTIKALQAARASVDAPTTPLQDALDRSLRSGWTADSLKKIAPAEARSLSAVATWWDGNRSVVPSPERALSIVTQANLFSDARAMATDHFVGRQAVLEELAEHFRSPSRRPYLLHGVGGVGKSALVARHLIACVDDEGAIAGIVDFDETVINPHFPVGIVARLIGQFAGQVEGLDRRRLTELGQYAEDEVETSYSRDASHSRASSRDTSKWWDLFNSALGRLPGDSPLLLVFDTFEQVQRRGQSAVASVAQLIHGLARDPRVRIVVSGRAEAPEVGPGRALTGLGRSEAVTLLQQVSGVAVPTDTATALVEHLGTSPLTVRLTAQLIGRGGTAPDDLFALGAGAEEIDAFLYDRVLDHLDPELRALAHPGLVLRRITPEVIQEVLARPCKLRLTHFNGAERLFNLLANEPMLVDRDPAARVLTHRSDVRALMLPQLLRDPKVDHRSVQRAAIRYYSRQDDPRAKVEELYHRLLLGQTERTLTRHWDERAAQELVPALDELPVASRVYVASHLPETYLSEDDRRLVDHANWVKQVSPQVIRLISLQEYDAALALLRERRSGDGESLLPDLEIEALEYLGRLSEAIQIARQQRRRAALRKDAASAVTFSLHLARLLERTGDVAEAVETLEEALARAAAEPTVDRLRVLVAGLGLDRRAAYASPEARGAREDEAVKLYEQLGTRKVRKVPGLVRDLAGETGNRSESILVDALQTVGLDARPSGDIAAALAHLSSEVSTPNQDFDVVADLAGLQKEESKAGSDEPWKQIVTKARGETGHALSEVLLNFSGKANQLIEAVTTDYQREADAAMFAEDLDADIELPS
jgi:tetratricopeptide (TPR) repeat protein